MTNSVETGNCYPSKSLSNCPHCGSELSAGADDRSFECRGCDYSEREVDL